VPLSTLEPWQPARVRQVTATGAVRRRLLDLGLLPDAGLRVESVAPTGDPMWIELAGSQLALRRREADSVLVERA
jgi:ferrous iron transport protein A